MLALLCVGGAGIAFVLYDKATKPDRSAPEVVVRNYLQALLIDRSHVRAEDYTCSEPGQLREIENFAKDVVDRERVLGVSIIVSIERIVVHSENGSSASVGVSVRRSATVDGVPQSLVDSWNFDLRNEGGWRVCVALRIGE
ncbi:MAG TPA: hypothetical protein VGD43_22365 [Micromonospora sp.]